MIDWASQRNYPSVIVSQDASPLGVPSQPGIAKEKWPIVSGSGLALLAPNRTFVPSPWLLSGKSARCGCCTDSQGWRLRSSDDHPSPANVLACSGTDDQHRVEAQREVLAVHRPAERPGEGSRRATRVIRDSVWRLARRVA
jgi:hypothetical protein